MALTRLGFIHPSPLNNRPGSRRKVEAFRNSGLTGTAIYKYGDLATLSSGNTTRLVEATPANIANVLIAAHDWTNPPTVGKLYNELIHQDDEFIATFQGGEADGSDGVFDAAAFTLVKQQTAVEMDYNATEDKMTVREGTTNPTVKLLRVFKGGVGVANTIVVVKFLPARLAGAV